MAVFSYLYYWNYICTSGRSVDDVLEEAAMLSPEQQMELLTRLQRLLVGTGVLPEGAAPEPTTMQVEL